MSGIIGKKIAMTSLYDENGKNIPCTIIEAGPCVVTQVRTQDKDGYESVQLGFDDKKEKNVGKAMTGHFKKAGTTPKHKLVEFYGTFVNDLSLGKLYPLKLGNTKDKKSKLICSKKVNTLMLQVPQKVKDFKGLLNVMVFVVWVKLLTDNIID